MERALLLAFVLLGLGALAVEAAIYRRLLRRIAWRVHVNGTRGKSSVVRLVCAGLRAGGWRVVGKTTGSAARIIFEDGSEAAILRPGRASIGEQRRFMAWAARRGVNAAVVECMAVRPEYQRATEEYLLRANVGVITNVRPDHLEAGGGDLDKTAQAFATTIPRGGVVVTTERERLGIFRDAARRRGSRMVAVVPTSDLTVPADPFPENVQLAADVCAVMGVDRATALRGMLSVQADPGAFAVFHVRIGAAALVCVNAFAANDPVSARVAAAQILPTPRGDTPVLALYNHRDDRPLRARQFVDLIAELAPAAALVVGDASAQIVRQLRARGLDRAEAVRAPVPAVIMEAVAARLPGGGIVLGLGNIAGVGMALVQWWRAAGRD